MFQKLYFTYIARGHVVVWLVRLKVGNLVILETQRQKKFDFKAEDYENVKVKR